MGQVFSLAYSIDGKLLLAGCINSIRVWDCEAWAMTAIVAIQVGKQGVGVVNAMHIKGGTKGPEL